MSTVYVGSASIDERGKATGGAAGDQTGKEVRIQAWYKHELGWVVIRAKSVIHLAGLAAAMRAACDNPNIGYDQNQRDTLYNAAKTLGFDPGRVAVKCECDCSSLVRVCLAYVGIMIPVSPRFSTSTMLNILKATALFDIITDSAYTDHPNLLLAGDILVTKTTGHTVIVLTDGDGKLDQHATLRKGSQGAGVKELQMFLNTIMDARLAVDGDFGPLTDMAVRAFQKSRGLEIDGVVGPITWAALLAVSAPTPVTAIPQTVRRGSHGEDVKRLQQLLNTAGAKPALVADSSFGPLTEAAVKTYQRVNDLTIDGVVGPQTWGSLLN